MVGTITDIRLTECCTMTGAVAGYRLTVNSTRRGSPCLLGDAAVTVPLDLNLEVERTLYRLVFAEASLCSSFTLWILVST